ncbi:MAG: stage II sporulation protein R, partial [Acutalibacteraceae bacterium]
IEKALLIGFVIAILFSFTSFTAFAAQCEQIPNEVFRLHVLANSDSEEDQALKLKVRDRLLDETGTLFSECTTKEEAMSAAKANIAYLEQVAQDEIYKQGYTYGVREVNMFTNNRQYDDITMPAGNYDALRVLIERVDKIGGVYCSCNGLPAAEKREGMPELDDVLTDEQMSAVEGNQYEVKFKTVEIYESIKSWFGW